MPSLPRGLQLIDGVLKGSPVRTMTNLRFQLYYEDDSGYMWITCIPLSFFSF